MKSNQSTTTMITMTKKPKRDEHARRQVRLQTLWLDSRDHADLEAIRTKMDLASDADALVQAIRVVRDCTDSTYGGKFERTSEGIMEDGEPFTFRVYPVSAKKLEVIHRWLRSPTKANTIRIVIRLGKKIICG